MDIKIIQNLMRERLTTAELMKGVSTEIGVSLATMYRYKSNPALMPLGKLVSLCRYLAFPLEGGVIWSKVDIVQGERRRYELEKEIANQPGGRRFVITPSFTVVAELPEITTELWEYDYSIGAKDLLPKYRDLRNNRSLLYAQGKYESFELINGYGYQDFFQLKNRFSGLTEELKNKQIQKLLETLNYPHVTRRVYLKTTPELPIFSSYSTGKAIIRIDDIVFEFHDEIVTSELNSVYHQYFEAADLKSKEQVRRFLENPF